MSEPEDDCASGPAGTSSSCRPRRPPAVPTRPVRSTDHRTIYDQAAREEGEQQ